ncbi:hypothetical protein [Parvibaculum sp.]|uniref:hypothetical protein n=1 Tax=Parvibaculum sp. TaxID=2024848 RepID=UPI003BAA9A0C
MATYEEIASEKRAKIEEFKESIQPLLDIDTEAFLQQPRWGSVTFNQLADDFDVRLKSILTLLRQSDLSFLSLDELTDLRNRVSPIKSLLDEISDFRIEDGDPGGRRDQILNRMRDQIRDFEKFVNHFSTPLLIQILSSDENKTRFESLISGIELGRSRIFETLSEVIDTKADIERILGEIRAAAAEAGGEKHSGIFDTESRSLRRWSYAWLVATGAAIFSTGYSAIYFYHNPIYVWSDMTMALQVVTAKILLLGLLISTSVWCGRNYRALAHEASVNRHRANALSTFRTFVSSTEDPDVKNAVLLETTRSIFSQAPSGYLDKHDNSGSDTRITEVVRSLNSVARIQS